MIKGIEAVLAHLHARAEQNQPLFGDPAEEAFSRFSSLGRLRVYRKIKRSYSQGRSLGRALSEIRDFPPYLRHLIARGEESGRLAGSLSVALNHYPLLNRFGPNLNGLTGYVFIILLFIIFFLIYFSLVFSGLHLAAMAENPSVQPGMFNLSFLGRYPTAVTVAGLIVMAVLVILRLFFNRGLLSFLARHIPLIRHNYYKLLSLEVGSMYLFNLESGLTPAKSLAASASGLKDAPVKRAITGLVAEVEGGRPYSRVLAASTRIRHLPVMGAIGLGWAAGRPGEMVEKMVRLLEKDLAANLNNDMKTVFNCGIVACGLLTGLAVIFAFKAIIDTYSWALY